MKQFISLLLLLSTTTSFACDKTNDAPPAYQAAPYLPQLPAAKNPAGWDLRFPQGQLVNLQVQLHLDHVNKRFAATAQLPDANARQAARKNIYQELGHWARQNSHLRDYLQRSLTDHLLQNANQLSANAQVQESILIENMFEDQKLKSCCTIS